MAPNTRSRIGLVLLGILIGVTGYGFFDAFQTYREARRRMKVTEDLKKISLALRGGGQANKVFPPGAIVPVSDKTSVIPFDTYTGYFVSNKFEPDAAESFVVIADQKRFDEVFGIGMVMGDKSHRAPKDLFSGHIVLAAIKRGKATCEFNVKGVTVKDGVVEFRYTTTVSANDSASYACPLIVSIPKDSYKSIQFIENGKVVKTIALPEKK